MDIKSLTEIEKLAAHDYLTELVTIRDIPEVQSDLACLDVTDVVSDVSMARKSDMKYYLIPVHNRYYIDQLYHNIHRRNKSYKQEKRTLAQTFLSIIEKYISNKFVFDYFSIIAIHGDDEKKIYYAYANTDKLTSDVVHRLLENGISDLNKYIENTTSKEYATIGHRYEVMKYVGYNGNEILDWLKDATVINMNDYIRNDVGTKQLTLTKNDEVFHIMINDHIIKVKDTEFTIISENIFASLFSVQKSDSDIYYYSSDTLTSEPISSGDIVNNFVKSENLNIDENTIIDLDVNAGTKRILFAYPEVDPEVTSISRLDYYGDGDYVDIFEQTIIPIVFDNDTVINYRVYFWIVREALVSNMKFRIKFQ